MRLKNYGRAEAAAAAVTEDEEEAEATAFQSRIVRIAIWQR